LCRVKASRWGHGFDYYLLLLLLLFQFCDVAKDDLAKFDYRLDMKVEKKSELFCILGYLLELIIQI